MQKQIAEKIVITKNPAEDLHRLFAKLGYRLATAESCTGGLVGGVLTSLPGISSVYLGGFVTYTNQMKIDLLGVDPAAIEQYTEVSAEVARQMAKGTRERTGAEIAISLTGVAGPGGGSEQTPVGTVYIGVSSPEATYAERYCMPSYLPRHEIRCRAALLAITLATREAKIYHMISQNFCQNP
ncbi:MAG: CinA family protein [Clostridia bacterium]|nr:CinA family protein [Clostridia bacterium]